ncbi:MAG: DUF58 domain-containing protein [Chloroherpetonaceae bacterium]|jgi:uncharacterized protein (DUF58 family)|nr:DUF58 domain-containing protein [bacterium]HAW09418.1 DUF58 domain-containing protein [Bacteroidota bacterium]
MDTQEIFKKIRKIEIKTRGLSRNIFAGEYQSAFKGTGMTFSEVREYQPGDDIRLIDWNVTARFNHPFIKIFTEERELTVILMIDVSGSEFFGTHTQLKKDLITEISALISFSAIANNDKIGVILFSSQIEKFIPPKKGRSHILRIIRELLDFEPKNKGTDLSNALEFLSNTIKKRAIVFILSDFLTNDNFEKPLSIACKKHDTIAIQVLDKMEKELPNLGLIDVFDPETQQIIAIDTSSYQIREQYKKLWTLKQKAIDNLRQKLSIDSIKIYTGDSYIAPLQQFFKLREWRRQY